MTIAQAAHCSYIKPVYSVHMSSYKDISYILPTPTFAHIRIGAYPSQEQADELINDGYSVFVDLTLRGEIDQEYIIPVYVRYIAFPIIDRDVPISEESFFLLIQTIGKLAVLRAEKIYIHCLGGHGRSGLLGIAFLIYLRYVEMQWNKEPILSLPYEKVALEITKRVTESHKTRKNMKDVWREREVLQTTIQKNYCVSFANFIQSKLRR